jgi:hypothetical protein
MDGKLNENNDKKTSGTTADETIRSIIEDLLPLYGEGLLRDETVRWLKEQAKANPEYQQLLNQAGKPLEPPMPEVQADYEAMMRGIRRKLSVLQIILVALSFLMAMSTSLMGNSFGFVLWYAVLGGVMFLFYRDWRLVLLASFVPIFLWLFADTLQGWLQARSEGSAPGGFFTALAGAAGGSLFMAGIHALFALVGMGIVWLAFRKKPLAVTLSVVLALGVLYVYDAFNGNPVSKWLAERELKAYLAETYPGETFQIGEGFYNFKFSSYEFDVIAIGRTLEDGKPAEYDFTLRGWIPKVTTDGIYYDRLDYSLMERLGEEASAEIEALLAPEIPSLRGVSVYLEVPGGTLPEDVVWRKDLPGAEKMWIGLLLDAEGLTKADVLAAARKTQALLDEAGYVYRAVNINANELPGADVRDPGPLRFAASFEAGEDLSDLKIDVYNEN